MIQIEKGIPAPAARAKQSSHRYDGIFSAMTVGDSAHFQVKQSAIANHTRRFCKASGGEVALVTRPEANADGSQGSRVWKTK